jgi:ribosomal protein L7/L12
MNKEHVLDRLELLIKLCDKTEPDVPDEKTLFSGHYIAAREMVERVSNKNFDFNGYSMVDIMKQANKLWKLRNKIHNGEWDSLKAVVMMEEVEDFIADNQKINAIKHYRHEMKEKLNEEVSLREAKDFVDQLQATMKSRGMIA